MTKQEVKKVHDTLAGESPYQQILKVDRIGSLKPGRCTFTYYFTFKHFLVHLT